MHAAVRAAVDSRAVRVICPLVASVTSVRAMRGYRGSGWGSSIGGAVDVEFCTAVRDLYLQHGAWTWDRGWRFPAEEQFAELLPGCDDPVKTETLSWVVGPEDQWVRRITSSTSGTPMWHISLRDGVLYR